MTLSDKINLTLAIASFLLAAVSVVTVVITLRQNSKMLELSSRPYLALYGAVTGFDATIFYLVLRNFGQSAAHIVSFSSNVDLSKCNIASNLPVPFSHIVGHTIAPGQAIHVPINQFLLKMLSPTPTFTVKYSFNGKEYSEVYTLNIASYMDVIGVHTNRKVPDSQVISRALQEMIVNQL